MQEAYLRHGRITLAEVKAQYEAAQAELARLQKEQEQLTEAVFLAAQHGDLFIAHFGDCIRQACERTDVDADLVIQKVQPLTLEFLLGGKRSIRGTAIARADG